MASGGSIVSASVIWLATMRSVQAVLTGRSVAGSSVNVVAGLAVRFVSVTGVRGRAFQHERARAGVHRLAERHRQVGIDRDARRVRRRGRRRDRRRRVAEPRDRNGRGRAAARERHAVHRSIPRVVHGERHGRRPEAVDDDAEARLGQPEQVADVDRQPLACRDRQLARRRGAGVGDQRQPHLARRRGRVADEHVGLFARRAAVPAFGNRPREGAHRVPRRGMPFVPGPVPPPHRALAEDRLRRVHREPDRAGRQRRQRGIGLGLAVEVHRPPPAGRHGVRLRRRRPVAHVVRHRRGGVGGARDSAARGSTGRTGPSSLRRSTTASRAGSIPPRPTRRRARRPRSRTSPVRRRSARSR